MIPNSLKAYILLFLCATYTLSTFSQDISINDIYVENKQAALGIDRAHPHFSWKMQSDQRGVRQRAYEILVSEEQSGLEEGKELVWNSGKVVSNQSVHIPYEGRPLSSLKKYFWKVRVWDQDDKPSSWSESAYWQMGVIDTSQWLAKWIEVDEEVNFEKSRNPIFRNEFRIFKKVKSATAVISSRGMYEAYLNGNRIGDAYFTPGWTSYKKRLQYQLYDVTKYINQGNNAIGAKLGRGWYSSPLGWEGSSNIYGDKLSLLLQLHIQYADGSSEIIVTDDKWKWSHGEILSSEIYDGEYIDSRLEQEGWSEPNFDDTNWNNVSVSNWGYENLVGTINKPVRKQEEFKPIDIITTPEGDTVLDFGQNLVGFVTVKASGKEGDQIILEHAEVLDKNGNFYTENLRDAKQKNVYILKGDEQEIFEPHFSWQGFRYVKVKDYPGIISTKNFTAVALYSDMEETGSLKTSNELVNQLIENITWGQKGNFLEVPTDCPQRDERLGWTGDAQVFARTSAYNMQVENFFSKWLKDLAADQLKNGSVPYVVPNILGPDATGSAGWGDAAVVVPWQLYLAYGNKRILKEQYDSMKGWVDYMVNQSEEGLWTKGFHFGDWLFYKPEDDHDGRAALTDKHIIAQCFFAHSAQLLVNTAEVLGENSDAEKYSKLLRNIKSSFLKEYVTPNGRLTSNTQTAYVLSLHFDMLPENLRNQAAKRLAENIISYDYHLTTGFLGTPYLNHVLTRYGYQDLAYTLLMQKTYPSWLYPVTVGATTIWERWDGRRPDGTFQAPSMNSFNHYAYGAIGDWLYEVLGGISSETSPGGVGYKKILIKPYSNNNILDETVRNQHKINSITSASAELETNYGKLKSLWKKNEKSLSLYIEIPVNTTAKVYFPEDNIDNISESNQLISSIDNIRTERASDGMVVAEIGSGVYEFELKKNRDE